MGDLLHILHADQRRINGEPPFADLATGSEMVRVYELTATLGETRVRADAAEADAAELRAKLHQAQARAERLAAELRTLKGDDATPDRGCQIISVPYECGYLLVECEVEEGEPATWDHPGAPGRVSPIRVFVGGRWLGVLDLGSFLQGDTLRERCEEALS